MFEIIKQIAITAAGAALGIVAVKVGEKAYEAGSEYLDNRKTSDAQIATEDAERKKDIDAAIAAYIAENRSAAKQKENGDAVKERDEKKDDKKAA